MLRVACSIGNTINHVNYRCVVEVCWCSHYKLLLEWTHPYHICNKWLGGCMGLDVALGGTLKHATQPMKARGCAPTYYHMIRQVLNNMEFMCMVITPIPWLFIHLSSMAALKLAMIMFARAAPKHTTNSKCGSAPCRPAERVRVQPVWMQPVWNEFGCRSLSLNEFGCRILNELRCRSLSLDEWVWTMLNELGCRILNELRCWSLSLDEWVWTSLDEWVW